MLKRSILLFLAMLYFGFCWLYKLEMLPGLHGDEAWSGIQAIGFMNNGVDRFLGMNNYTGILQVLVNEFNFKLFGTGVLQLRFGTAFFNLLGLFLFGYTMMIYKFDKLMSIFLIILCQSALFLTYPRVSWEVNTFTFFFLSLTLLCILELNKKIERFSIVWVLLFFILNIIGTYNHVIYSCFSVSAFIGLVLWSIWARSNRYFHYVVLLALNLINLISIFLMMRFWIDFVSAQVYLCVATLVLLLTAEVIIYKWLKNASLIFLAHFVSLRSIVVLFMVIAVFAFIWIHGWAFFDVISGYKLFMQLYSYESSTLMMLVFSLTGMFYIILFSVLILNDILNDKESVWAFLIIGYMGLLTVYTQNSSFRYYMVFYLMTVLYISYKLSSQPRKVRVLLVLPMLIGICLRVVTLSDIFIRDDTPLKALRFRIGNHQKETSAHFLPKQPLITYLVKNQINTIREVEGDRYFIQQPVQFYYMLQPWKRNANNEISVGYNYDKLKTGFLILDTKANNP